MYEFATATVLVAVVAYVVLAFRSPGLRHIGLFVLAPVVLSMVLIGLFLYTEAAPLVAYCSRLAGRARHHRDPRLPASSSSAASRACCTWSGRGTRSGWPPTSADDAGIVSRLPGAAALDRVAHRTAVFGFPIWTFAVIAGAIWAESAWGRFWGWDPKETWAFIAWVVYAAYLHARTTAGWRGRPAARKVNVVGLVVMIFNLLYVNMVSTGLHESYGGLD